MCILFNYLFLCVLLLLSSKGVRGRDWNNISARFLTVLVSAGTEFVLPPVAAVFWT